MKIQLQTIISSPSQCVFHRGFTEASSRLVPNQPPGTERSLFISLTGRHLRIKYLRNYYTPVLKNIPSKVILKMRRLKNPKIRANRWLVDFAYSYSSTKIWSRVSFFPCDAKYGRHARWTACHHVVRRQTWRMPSSGARIGVDEFASSDTTFRLTTI